MTALLCRKFLADWLRNIIGRVEELYPRVKRTSITLSYISRGRFILDANAFISRLTVLLDLDSKNTSASSLLELSATMYIDLKV